MLQTILHEADDTKMEALTIASGVFCACLNHLLAQPSLILRNKSSEHCLQIQIFVYLFINSPTQTFRSATVCQISAKLKRVVRRRHRDTRNWGKLTELTELGLSTVRKNRFLSVQHGLFIENKKSIV